MNIVGLSISQWLPCPLAIWAFGFDGKSCEIKQKPVTDVSPTAAKNATEEILERNMNVAIDQ